MHRTLIAMLIVLALSVCICIVDVLLIGHVTDEIDVMRVDVLRMVEADDSEGAKVQLAQLAEMWERHESMLEIIAPHEDLHRITELIIEGDANLEAGDHDDFNRSMALLGEAIHHLYEEERLTLSNVL